jgi:hypothetical protein
VLLRDKSFAQVSSCSATLPGCSYELPPRFNSHLLQYRDEKLQCTYRYYDEHNGTIFEDSWGYGGCATQGAAPAVVPAGPGMPG